MKNVDRSRDTLTVRKINSDIEETTKLFAKFYNYPFINWNKSWTDY